MNLTDKSESEDVCLGQHTPEDFFSFLMSSSSLKTFSLATSAITVVFVPVLLFLMIQFDKQDLDQRRTLLNRLYVSIWMVLIELIFVIQLTEIFRFVFGPMPKFFCLIKTVARTAYTVQLLLYLDAIAITRFLFIFWLKNPVAFQDGFWSAFFSRWIRLASWLSTMAGCFLADRQLINYYICSGEDPTEDFKKPQKSSKFVEIGSLVIHLIVYLKIKIYKMSNSGNVQPSNGSIGNKFLTEMRTQSLESFSRNIIDFSLLGMTLLSASYLSKLEPAEMCNNKAFLQLHYLVQISASALIGILLYYLRHKPLQHFCWSGFKEFILRLRTAKAT